MATKVRYSIPYKACAVAKRCTSPFHLSIPGARFCIDFYLPIGMPVLAARSGVVIETESRYGKSGPKSFIDRCNFVVIRHRDGQISVYAHLSRRSVKVRLGEKVKRGQIIGLSGQTGYAAYPHLHFGVYNSKGESILPTFNSPLPPKVNWERYANQ